jgi:hypothetical protein
MAELLFWEGNNVRTVSLGWRIARDTLTYTRRNLQAKDRLMLLRDRRHHKLESAAGRCARSGRCQ